MLDARFVADNPDTVRESLNRRGAGPEAIAALERIVVVNAGRRALQTETDKLRSDRKSLSKQIGPLMQSGRAEEAEPLKAQVKAAAEQLESLEAQRKALEVEERSLLLGMPNLLDERVPEGRDETCNQIVRTWGQPPEFTFEPKDHVELGESLDILDFGRGAKLSGARFTVLKGAGARLERALINFFVDRGVGAGYQEVMVPYIVSRTTMTGTGQLPKFETDLFRLTDQLAGEDAFLIPTAEVPVTNLHRDEILQETDLPLRYVCFTPNFRSEAGSYGKDVRGYLRQHQFHKVELVKITTPDQAAAEHEGLTADAEAIMQDLGLPYRVASLCSGDVGFGAKICYDVEVWLPGQGAYREISSCSSYGDFQSRRMRIRYRPEAGGKPILCHTINGSGLAVGRTLIALLENHQQSDGSVDIPEVLRPYMGGLDRIAPGE